MAETKFNHLINIIYNSIGADQATKEALKFEDTVKRLQVKWDIGAGGEQKIKSITASFADTSKEAKTAAKGTGDFIKALRRAAIVAPVWLALRNAMLGVINLVKNQIKFLLDTETALARIQIVGKGTTEELIQLRNSLVSLSVAYGVSASEALDAAQIFAQQGRTIAETFNLTRAAMIGAQALGTDLKTTVDNLTSAVEGFNVPVSESLSIIDKWVAVEKNFAVTAKDLADATKTAGATANQLGVSIDSFLGDITAIIEVTRKSGSAAANALQFIYARLLTTAKPVLTTIAEIPLFLDKTGQATYKLTGTTRSLSAVLIDLSTRWNTLTKDEKQAIAQQVASKRQLTSFLALMQNYSTALEARIKSAKAAGEAERAFGIIQETTRFKTQQLASAWNALTNVIADTGAIKKSTDALSYAVRWWTKLVNAQKAVEIQANEDKDTLQKQTELQIGQIQALKDLVKLREDFLQAKMTPELNNMLQEVDDEIKNIIREKPYLKDLFTKGFETKNIVNNLDDIQANLRRRQISAKVSLDIQVERASIVKQVEKLNREIENIEGSRKLDISDKTQQQLTDLYGQRKKLASDLYDLQSKFIQEVKKETQEYDIQLETLEKRKQTQEEINAFEEESVTLAQQEKLRAELALNVAKSSSLLTSEQQLALEYQLVAASEMQYEPRAKALKLAELEGDIVASQVDEANKLIDHELELARIRGASGIELVNAEARLKSMVFGEQAVTNSLDLRLEKEKAITEEKANQNKLSSESLELYKVATRFGNNVAASLARVLQGQQEITSLSNREQGIFKKFFGAEFEQIKAQKFFEGRGAGIPIRETNAISGIRTPETNINPNLFRNLLTQPLAGKSLQEINIRPIEVTIDAAQARQQLSEVLGGAIKVEIDVDKMKTQVEGIIEDALDNDRSDISQKVDQRIDNF